MAMLAEPKRRSKYGNDPRNTFWSSDENKFGFRMLESMGWKKGKGLGAKESGMTEPVKSVHRQNTDVRGVGCSKSHGDKWIAHQDDFNALLSDLNENSIDYSTCSASASDTAISLVQKSKTSRNRLHYQKFTKGKDLSSRSSHDLDCIFGKRKGHISETTLPAIQSETTSDEGDKTQLSCNLSTNTNHCDDPSNNHHHGIKTFTSSSNIQEYFAKKMAWMKQKTEACTLSDISSVDGHKECWDSANGKMKAIKQIPAENGSEDQGGSRQRKKKCKQVLEQEDDSQGTQNKQGEDNCNDEFEEQQSNKPKKKRKKEKCDFEQDSGETVSGISRKSKKRKKGNREKLVRVKHECENTSCITDDMPASEDVCIASKKSKRKNKKKLKQSSTEEFHNTNILRTEKSEKKKVRKSVSFCSAGDQIFMIPAKEDCIVESQLDDTPMMGKLPQKMRRDEITENTEAPSKKKCKVEELETVWAETCKEKLIAEDRSTKETPENVRNVEMEDATNVLSEKIVESDKPLKIKSNCVAFKSEAENNTKAFTSTNVQINTCDDVSLPINTSLPKNKHLAHFNRICKRFKGSNLDCVKGYQNDT